MPVHSNSDQDELELEVEVEVEVELDGAAVAEDRRDLIAALAGGLVVSCQASANHPMRSTDAIVRMAESAILGGAAGLRINSPADVRAVRARTGLPIIGLDKEQGARRNVITERVDQARGLVDAGADIVAVDATVEVFADIAAHVRRMIDAVGVPVMADVSTIEEGLLAWEGGAALVGTTLSGYTPYTQRRGAAPDVELVSALANAGVRVVAEGRYSAPVDVRRAFDAGAFAVVVGGAITDPVAITRRFVAATRRTQ